MSPCVLSSIHIQRDRDNELKFYSVWRAAYAPGDGQTSPAYSSQPVQCLYINHLLSVNKPVLSYLLLRLLPQAYLSIKKSEFGRHLAICFVMNLIFTRTVTFSVHSFLTLWNIPICSQYFLTVGNIPVCVPDIFNIYCIDLNILYEGLLFIAGFELYPTNIVSYFSCSLLVKQNSH
jgi:hypothetical protein